MTKKTQPEAVEEAVVAEAEPASLTINDLASIRRIIDIASQRGAFKAAEFTAVGDVYSKLDKFITAITPAPAAEVEEATTEGAE